MGKKVKKKARSGTKDKRVPSAPSKTVSQVSITNTETPSEEVVVVKQKRVCPHLGKGIDLENVSAKIKSSEPLRCEDCRDVVIDKRASKGKGKQGKKKGGTESNSASKAIWVCLECGHFSCGGAGLPTTPQSHAVRHAKQHRHPLAVQFENPLLRWCFHCSTIIPVEKSEDSGEQKDVLRDIVKLIKGRSPGGPTIDVEATWFGSGSESVTSGIKSESSVSIDSGVSGGYTVKGLSNLGNTCFFNSIMQNLLAMDKLRDYFLNLDGSLGPLTAALKKLYIETNPESGSRGVINPRSFFGCLCAKAPQFRGYQQHDSHELLRCLLDALCIEESSARKQAKSSNDGGKCPRIDSTFVDAIFGGQLSSTVSCLDCGHSSTVYEPFLDLSLPVPTKRPPFKKTQSVPRTKKAKVPPKRSARLLSKVNKNANTLPAHRAADEATGCRSSLQVQSSLTVVDQSVTLSGDSISLDASGGIALTNESDLVSQDLVAPQNVGSKQGSEDDSTWLDFLEPDVASEDDKAVSQIGTASMDKHSGTQNTILRDTLLNNTLEPSAEIISTCMDAAPHSGDTTCLDSSGPGKLSDCDRTAAQTNDEVTTQETRTKDAVLSDLNLEHSSESCNNDSKVGVDSYRKLWDDEIPMQVQDSPVILLPYKEDSSISELSRGEGEVSSSAVECDPDSGDFDGFGGLFNEPETATEPSLKPLISATLSSESDPDEVDNTDAPVSVQSCLSHFIKPEILSRDEHAWQCERCSKVLLEEKIRLRKKLLKTKSDIMINGKADRNPSNSTGLKDLCNGMIERDVLGSNHDSQHPHNGEMNDEENGVLDMSEKTELKPVASQSPNLDKPVSEESRSNEINGSVESDSDSVKHVGSNSLGVNSQSEGSEDEEMDNENVKVKRDATKRILIDRAPPILTIHLKRFTQDARGRLSKLNGHVGFRDTMDLRLYIDPRCPEKDRYKYRLLGVVEHSGTMRGGHYVAYVRGRKKGTRRPENGNEDFIWYHASDAYVREATLEEVLRSEAYILFYEQT